MTDIAMTSAPPSASTGEGAGDPSFAVALLPIILVIALNYLFTAWILPQWDTGFLAQPKYGATNLSGVAGLWSIVMAVAISCIAVVALNWRRFPSVIDSVNKGTFGAMLPMFNTASEVGYGAVIASLASFVLIRDALTSITPNPVVSVAITVNVLSGITGSASGGLSIALASFGDFFVEHAKAAGISMDIMHRAATMASGGMDALPHNGAVITLLAICGLNHRQSYFDIFMVATVITVAAGAAVIVLWMIFGTF
jgi:H+/gluconate symporter-like permease